jgi:hypothetical protein
VYQRFIRMTLAELQIIDEQIGQLDQEMATLLTERRDAVQRLAEVPGYGWTRRIRSSRSGRHRGDVSVAETPRLLDGPCPGNDEIAGVNCSHRCPKGNRQMRRVLNQAANAAVKAKGTIFAIVY